MVKSDFLIFNKYTFVTVLLLGLKKKKVGVFTPTFFLFKSLAAS